MCISFLGYDRAGMKASTALLGLVSSSSHLVLSSCSWSECFYSALVLSCNIQNNHPWQESWFETCTSKRVTRSENWRNVGIYSMGSSRLSTKVRRGSSCNWDSFFLLITSSFSSHSSSDEQNQILKEWLLCFICSWDNLVIRFLCVKAIYHIFVLLEV